MGKEVHVAGGEDETAAELEGMLAELGLAEAGDTGALAGGGVVATEKMQQIGGAEGGDSVGFTIFVDEKGKRDVGLLAEDAGVARVAQADGGEMRTLGAEGGFVFAQPGDVLAAEDSAVVAEEYEDGGSVGPEVAKRNRASVTIGQRQRGESRAQGGFHRWPLWTVRGAWSRPKGGPAGEGKNCC